MAERLVKERSGRRIMLSGLGVVAVVGAAAVVGFLIVSHFVTFLPRINVGRLSTATGGGETILLTGAGFGPTGMAAPSSAAQFSGLIVLMHINADKRAGAVVSIPPTVVVPVPGKGRTEVENALAEGGPALLVQTLERLTHVPINHYARLDFDHVSNVINTLGGVDVSMLKPSVSYGYRFHAGINQLNGVTSIYYARDLGVSNADRILRQQNLMRAILSKVARRHLISNPLTTYHVVSGLTSMMTVDSNFTDSDLLSLARQLSSLSGKAGTFVTAPFHRAGKIFLLDTAPSDQLWQAIKHGSVAAFARKYPSTVTPPVVP